MLAEVWGRAFFSRRRDSAFVYSKVGLSDLYCQAAEDFIQQRGGMVASRMAVETLEMDGDHTVGCVRLRDGRKLEAANFVVAVPNGALLAMLPEPHAGRAVLRASGATSSRLRSSASTSGLTATLPIAPSSDLSAPPPNGCLTSG